MNILVVEVVVAAVAAVAVQYRYIVLSKNEIAMTIPLYVVHVEVIYPLSNRTRM